MTKHLALTLSAFTLATMSAAPASAAPFIVAAKDNSVSGGTALATGLIFSVGQLFSVSADINDLWSAGALPRFSDADGLRATQRLANALDDSGQPVGTLIGKVSGGLTTIDGFAGRGGSLVGRISGVYQQLGTSFSGPAWANGELELFYWDINNGDNSGTVTFEINNMLGVVPEPASWAFMILGMGAVGATLRRRRASQIRQAQATR